MPDPRRYIGVRISEQGHRYIQLVADRDHINYSTALRHLLALGVRTDMEAHDDSRHPANSAGRSVAVSDVRTDDGDDRDRHSDPGSDGVSRLPDRGPTAGTDPSGPANIGDAIGNLYRAGLNPSQEDDGPSAA